MQHPSLILTRPTGRRGRWGMSGGRGGPAAATALAVAATTAPRHHDHRPAATVTTLADTAATLGPRRRHHRPRRRPQPIDITSGYQAKIRSPPAASVSR